MICPQCQAVNQQDWAFCGNCGNPLNQPAPGPGGQGSVPQSTIQSEPGPPPRTGPSQPPAGPPYQYGPGPQDNRYAPGPPDNRYAPGPPAAPDAPGGWQAPGPPGAWQPPGAPGGWQAPRPPAQARPSFHMDLRRLTRIDQTVGGASLVVLLSLFLPWFGFEGATESGTSAHGYLALAAILAVVMVAYLVLRSGWDEFPLNLPIAHAPLLLISTALQLLLVFIGFISKPGVLSWEIGAYLALIASVAAAGPVVVPAIRSFQGSR